MKISADDLSIITNCRFRFNRRYAFAFVILFFILFLSYSNSFDCSWHFDDYDNITDNVNIQVQQFTWENVKKISLGIMGSSRISRPVSYLSFAANYYFGGLDVFGYHVVNFFIHFLAASFLFLFISNTLRLPLLRDRYAKHAASIALLASLLWAINPVQVTAVTYIVQRMASMVALFYIMAMYFYLKFRTADITAKAVIYLILALVCAFLAIGTKENAAMLPLAVLLYDLFFLQGLTRENIKKNVKILIIPVALLLFAGLLFYDFSAIAEDYKLRPFTMTERLLTEPRVILFYISLLFYPLTSRLTLIHDFAVSKGIFDPWTTAPAILAIAVIIIFCLIKAKKWPLFAYCMIFFFLNHFIEGSFLSLEIIFEHRNYLPSMLLFVPPAVLLVRALEYFYRKKIIFYSLTVMTTALLVILAVSVYIQNDIMKNEISLWSDNVEKSPRLHHPRQSLAVALFIAGRLPEARQELERALNSYESGLIVKKNLTYGCLGEYYFVTGDDRKAFDYLSKSVNLYPPYSYVPLSFDRMAIILMREGALQKAEEMALKAISLKPQEAHFHLTYSEILLKKGQPEAAIKAALQALKANPSLVDAYKYIADAFALKKNSLAEDHFRKLSKKAIGL